ncbi:hypothetical protein ACFFGT_06225 [Mucilaginibacter angelicae]|uniref:Uncharacterized protein n=1 Tax=Mucilaginibacter angelicae TaxID=869718 RepID=A0ABV6L3F5_9SPHI
MDLTLIMKLISIVLAISLASERLVAFFKTLIPPLAGPQPPNVEPEKGPWEWGRKIIVMLIAFFASWIAAAFLNEKFDLRGCYLLSTTGPCIPFVIIALMASGGSAFWTNLLGYTKAIKDIQGEKITQEKIATQQKSDAFAFRNNGLRAFSAAGGTIGIVKKTIQFDVAFSGGIGGNLTVQFENGLGMLNFSGDGTQTLDLPQQALNYTISGNAPNGPGGGVQLSISGDVISNSPHNFGSGIILPNVQSMIVT